MAVSPLRPASGDPRTVFPRSRNDLMDTTKCPACFVALESLDCGNCGLDLRHPAAAEVAAISAEASVLLDRRASLIQRMRTETAAAMSANVAAAIAAQEIRLSPEPRPAEERAAVAAPPPPVDLRPETPSAPRRSSVQVALLVVGVSLVSIAAIFFLVYAFVTYGIVWQSVIIGAITVAAFVTASRLRSAGLGATAEAIGALAVVLVYLDAYAVRANNLFSSASGDALVYWGVALVASSVGFVAWHRAAALRVARVAAFVSFAPGAGLLVAGLAEPLDPATRVFLGFLAVALAGLLHPLVRPTAAAPSFAAERTIALVIASLAGAAAYVTAFTVQTDSDVASLLTFGAIAAVGTAHAVVASAASPSAPVLRGTARAFAALAGLSASTAIVSFSYRALPSELALVVSAGGTAAVALLLVALLAREPSRHTDALRAAALPAVGLAALTLLPSIGFAIASVARVLQAASPPAAWLLRPDAVFGVEPHEASAVVALLVVVALCAVAAVARREIERYRTPLAWAGAAALVLAVPVLDVLWAVLAGWLLLGALAIGALVWSRTTTTLPRSLASVATATAIASGALAYVASWSSAEAWTVVSLFTIVLLLCARAAFARAESASSTALLLGSVMARSILLASAGIVGIVTSAGVAPLARLLADRSERESLPLDWAGTPDALRFATTLAILLVGVAAVPAMRALSTLDRHVLFGIGAVAVTIGVPLAAGQRGAAAPATSTVLAVALVAALLAWIVPRANAVFRTERLIAAVALPVALFWAAHSIADWAGAGDDVLSLVPVATAVIVAGGALALEAIRPGLLPRWTGDTGIAIVAIPGLFVALASGIGQNGSTLVWLALLFAAVAALLLALGPDGLIGAASPRRHLGWVALGLATVGLWTRLAATSVDQVEAYVLPLAGALLLIALLVWRADRLSAAPAGLAFGGLLVAVVPIAAVGVDGAVLERTLTIGIVSVALLLGGSLLRGSTAARPYLDAGATAGLVGLVIVSVGTGVRLLFDANGTPGAELDAWLGAAFLVLGLAALGQASGRAGDRPFTGRIAVGLFGTAMSLVLVFEITVLDQPLGTVRAVAVVLLFSAIHVLGAIRGRAPVTAAIGWIAVCYAGVVALAAAGVVDVVEWVTLPIAAVLLASGTVRLSRTPTLRSWPALGLGLAVLFAPSLLASTGNRPLWRLVAIGVVAIAVLVIGFLRRLQAPFVVGAVVALVHGVATFSPQLATVYESTEWWVWAGAGGVLIIVLAARYERSVATARSLAVSVGSLR